MAKKIAKKQSKKQQQMYMIGGGVIAALILVGAVIFIVQRGAAVEVCNYEDAGCYSTYLSIEDQGLTEENIPYIGSEDAPIVIGEFADFSCPHCADFHPTTVRLVEDFVATGQARFEFFPMIGVNPPYSERAARAAVCAAEQGAFWQYHDELFELQRAETSRAFDNDTLISMAKDMGLDGSELEACINSNRPGGAIASTQALASRLGVTGTPSVAYSLDNGATWQRVNADYNQIRQIIESVNN